MADIRAVQSTRYGPSSPAWHDLATHRAGQAARAEAERRLVAMKQRSRVRAFISTALDIKTDERAWRVGAAGEAIVGARLEKLTKHGWHVLHAVPVGRRGSDIDHVAIGPGGVFTINTKRRPRSTVWIGEHAIQVNGQPTPYLRNSRHEGARATASLSEAVGFHVPVRPVLVFVMDAPGSHLSIKRKPSDVTVAGHKDIARALRRSVQRLDIERVETIYEQARRCTTWTESAVCSCAPVSS